LSSDPTAASVTGMRLSAAYAIACEKLLPSGMKVSQTRSGTIWQ
jgi:hypothetical protein